MFETGLYWADILQDAMILLAFYKEEFYGFLFLGICFMMVPPICVWAFRYALGRAQVSNLLLSIIQLEFVYQSTMSLVTVERTTDLFWQTAGEGGLEAPLQCILQIYKVLVTGQQERVPQFMLSIITSLFCTANSFAKLDKYGSGLSVLSREHARQVCWRILWLAPRLLGLPVFAYLTRPHHVGLHENKQVVVFLYAALELLFTWQIVIRRSSVPYVLGVQLFFAALTMMAVPPVMLPSVRRMLPVYATQRLMSFFVMALLGISMSPINTAHAQLLLQPPAVIILAVFLLTFLSWLVSAINILVQQCCHRDTNGREDDYALLGKEPGLKLESEKQERQLAVALREAVASGDEILTTFLLQEGASVDGKHDPGVGVLELDLWRGQKFAEAMTGLEVQMCGRSAGLLTMNIPAPDDDGEWYYEVEIFQHDPASFRVGWAVPGDCMRMPEMGPFRPLGGLEDIGEDDSPTELSMVSSFAAAWVVEVTSGHILHTDGAGTSSKVAFLPEAKVLGCVAKIRSGTAQVFFVTQGDAGAEVTEACTFDIQGRTLLPAISVMGSSWHFKVNVGNEPFLLKPFGAAAVLTARTGDPPAVTAARNGHWTTCRLLLDRAADVNSMESIRRRTMLHYFADQGQEDAVRCLIERQADIWLQDSDEQDALTLAQSAETGRLILRAAGDRLKELISRPSRGGWFTALHHAAEHGNAVLVRLLLEWRAEVDGPVPQTPLIWAAARGRKECAEILIRGRADVSRRDQAGLDALSWAEEAYVSKLGGFAKLPEEQCDALQKDLLLLLSQN